LQGGPYGRPRRLPPTPRVPGPRRTGERRLQELHREDHRRRHPLAPREGRVASRGGQEYARPPESTVGLRSGLAADADADGLIRDARDLHPCPRDRRRSGAVHHRRPRPPLASAAGSGATASPLLPRALPRRARREPISTPRTPSLVPLPFREPAEGYEADDGDDDAEQDAPDQRDVILMPSWGSVVS
jgi:hypothetical protein